MRKPNQSQLKAVKMEHLQTTITGLTWGQVQDPSFRGHFAPKLSDSPSVYSSTRHPQERSFDGVSADHYHLTLSRANFATH